MYDKGWMRQNGVQAGSKVQQCTTHPRVLMAVRELIDGQICAQVSRAAACHVLAKVFRGLPCMSALHFNGPCHRGQVCPCTSMGKGCTGPGEGAAFLWGLGCLLAGPGEKICFLNGQGVHWTWGGGCLLAGLRLPAYGAVREGLLASLAHTVCAAGKPAVVQPAAGYALNSHKQARMDPNSCARPNYLTLVFSNSNLTLTPQGHARIAVTDFGSCTCTYFGNGLAPASHPGLRTRAYVLPRATPP